MGEGGGMAIGDDMTVGGGVRGGEERRHVSDGGERIEKKCQWHSRN